MKNLLLFSVLIVLTSCGTIETTDMGNGFQKIELIDPPIIGFPRQAAFAHPDVIMAMQTKAFELCPSGYNKTKEQYLKDNGHGKDALIWEIKCEK